MLDAKINVVRQACAPLIGTSIERYETAEILNGDGTWDDWADLPVRLYCSGDKLLSVSWSQFDTLWLSNDQSLPFETEDTTTRWKRNGLENINAMIGHSIQSVSLGRGQLTWKDREVEIWTRLLFELNGLWLEVFNALDENGYALHTAKPAGEFRQCN